MCGPSWVAHLWRSSFIETQAFVENKVHFKSGAIFAETFKVMYEGRCKLEFSRWVGVWVGGVLHTERIIIPSIGGGGGRGGGYGYFLELHKVYLRSLVISLSLFGFLFLDATICSMYMYYYLP